MQADASITNSSSCSSWFNWK